MTIKLILKKVQFEIDECHIFWKLQSLKVASYNLFSVPEGPAYLSACITPYNKRWLNIIVFAVFTHLVGKVDTLYVSSIQQHAAFVLANGY